MRILYALANTLLFGLMVFFNALANSLPLNGYNTGQISDMYPSLFTPAGISFSIWGLIYFWLLVWLIFNWISLNNEERFDYLKSLSPWFWISCILNAAWIVAWHYLYPGFALLIMLSLLFVLTKIFLFLNSSSQIQNSRNDRLINMVFHVYFAWICVATIANTSAWLLSLNFDSYLLSESTWTIIMMLMACALALIMLLKYSTKAYALVVVWALFGIAIRWQHADKIFFYTALGLCVVIFGVMSGMQKRKIYLSEK
ncbi:MAG TPA: tryptophan-rich sensory protein [Cyclobacteriaceae bacterium]|nr:tryptophan-rich sensory protein [Cyclobacteriaceae bacterium]